MSPQTNLNQSASQNNLISTRDIRVTCTISRLWNGDYSEACAYPHNKWPLKSLQAKFANANASLFTALTETAKIGPTYFLPYAPTKLNVRLATSIFDPDHADDLAMVGPINVQLAIFDVDCPSRIDANGKKHKPSKETVEEWYLGECDKIQDLVDAHIGSIVYRTEHGYRILSLLPSLLPIKSKADAQSYSRIYRAWVNYLQRAFSIKADCLIEWNRLSAVPHTIKRLGEPALNLELIGNEEWIGVWHPQLIDSDYPAEKQQYDGPPRNATGSALLKLVLRSNNRCDDLGNGIYDIQCPGIDGHSDAEDRPSQTYLYVNQGFNNAIECKHSSCKSKYLNGKDWLHCFASADVDAVEQDLRTEKNERLNEADRIECELAEKVDAAWNFGPPPPALEQELQAWMSDSRRTEYVEHISWWMQANTRERANDYVEPAAQPSPAPSEPSPAPKSETNPAAPKFSTFTALNATDDPGLRPWLIPNLAMYGQVTALIAAGGTGKSAFSIHTALSVATGRKFAKWQPKEQRNVLIMASEDDIAEQSRRMQAARATMGVDASEHHDRIFTLTSNSSLTLFWKDPKDGQLVHSPLFKEMVKLIDEKQIGLLIIDPFVEIQNGYDENSNNDIKIVVEALRSLAREKNLALMLVHHARKGQAGDASNQDSARGASAFINMARFSLNLERMSAKEAKVRKISEPYRYVKIDLTKSNYAPRGGSEWLQLVSVDLDCGEASPGLRLVDISEPETDCGQWLRDNERAFLDLVKGDDWCCNQRARKDSRLESALVSSFGLEWSEACDIVINASRTGLIVKDSVSKRGRNIDVWSLAPF